MEYIFNNFIYNLFHYWPFNYFIWNFYIICRPVINVYNFKKLSDDDDVILRSDEDDDREDLIIQKSLNQILKNFLKIFPNKEIKLIYN